MREWADGFDAYAVAGQYTARCVLDCVPASKAAPTILVMPTDFDLLCFDTGPPGCELLAREIVRCRGDEMIENN